MTTLRSHGPRLLLFVQSDSAAKAIAEFEPMVQSRESPSGRDP